MSASDEDLLAFGSLLSDTHMRRPIS